MHGPPSLPTATSVPGPPPKRRSKAAICARNVPPPPLRRRRGSSSASGSRGVLPLPPPPQPRRQIARETGSSGVGLAVRGVEQQGITPAEEGAADTTSGIIETHLQQVHRDNLKEDVEGSAKLIVRELHHGEQAHLGTLKENVDENHKMRARDEAKPKALRWPAKVKTVQRMHQIFLFS